MTRERRRPALLVGLGVCAVALAAAPGCPRPPPSPPAAALDVDDPDLLASSEAIEPDFLVHQRVHATFGERELVFQAVIQAARGRLTVIALTLQGARVFTLEQSGKRVSFERHTEMALPFSPKHILVDIHRAYFRFAASAPPRGDHRVFRQKGEIVRETWRRGVLIDRVVELAAAERPERIAIHYGSGGPRLLERPLSYRNGYLGYTLVVTPLRFVLLRKSPAGPDAPPLLRPAGSSHATEDE